jgi:cobalt-zinc-cadmium efflux system outer membrane protein
MTVSSLTLLNSVAILTASLAPCADAQTALTWQQIKDKFETTNPTLRAAALNVQESRAQEITAYLRPNPDFTLLTDGTQVSPYQGVWQPFAGTLFQSSFSYLHERDHKRELRLESAQKATTIAESQQADTERTLLFNLRSAFISALQAKRVLALAQANIEYFDRELGISRERFRAGDVARVDLDRIELQRPQYESDLQTAIVNVRTAKIQLLALLNERTPLDRFDVTGPFEFSETLPPLAEIRELALANRPDLKVAVEAVVKAETDHRLAVSNGSTDPTYSAWYSHNGSFNNQYANNTIGGSVTIPLRIFDRNQGEKERTQIDIRHAERLREAAEAQVFSDVDSAYYTVLSNINLLHGYRGTEGYLQRVTAVRETMSFSYQHGGASLLDFLDAQRDYRQVQLAYINLVGSYLTAAGQLNMAVGREVM